MTTQFQRNLVKESKKNKQKQYGIKGELLPKKPTLTTEKFQDQKI